MTNLDEASAGPFTLYSRPNITLAESLEKAHTGPWIWTQSYVYDTDTFRKDFKWNKCLNKKAIKGP